MRDLPSLNCGVRVRLACATAALVLCVAFVSITPAPSMAQSDLTMIVVEKQTDPDGAAGNFTFIGTAAGTISDNGQIVVPVFPGTYTSTEAPATGFDLTSISCDDSDSTGDTGTRTATFNVAPGETVTCTFNNRQQALPGPQEEAPSLALDVGQDLFVGHPATVRATGTAPSQLMLSMFVDPFGGPCPPSAAARPAKTRMLVSGLSVGGGFSAGARYRPTRPGRHTFCAYLGRSEDLPTLAATDSGTVKRAPRLRAAAARHMVRRALRRHGFAHRVIDEVDPRCHRDSRAAFRCQFWARFRGYQLEGRGQVRLTPGGIVYRFRVRAQGVRFVLTANNEGQAGRR